MLPANDGQAQAEARADAMVDLARACLKLRPRALGSGHELVVITTQERLEKGVDEVGAVMRDGTPLPLEVARMLACDSARVNVIADEQGRADRRGAQHPSDSTGDRTSTVASRRLLSRTGLWPASGPSRAPH